MLDFQFINGDRFALPYTSLLSLTLNPSVAITANFSTHIVKMTGVNLREIYEAMTTRSVGIVKAISERIGDYPDGVPVIRSIEVKSPSDN